jgi:hypothetical protein
LPEPHQSKVTSQVGTGGARFAGPPPAIKVSLGGFLLLFVASRLLYLVMIDPAHPLIYSQLIMASNPTRLAFGPACAMGLES